MKRLFLFSFIALFVFSCNNQGERNEKDLITKPTDENGNIDTSKLAKIEFEEDVYDFGKISQGEKVTHTFVFKNTGGNDLIIASAKGSCGCTVPSWPKKPIPPGEKGEIKVVFDSNGKIGRQHKTVAIVANTIPNTTIIALKGEVEAPVTK